MVSNPSIGILLETGRFLRLPDQPVLPAWGNSKQLRDPLSKPKVDTECGGVRL